MTINQLRYAVTIADTGSMNKASEVLYVAQPSLTGSIKELEKELGITIFYRGGRGVSLTGDGMEFITYAKSILQQCDDVLDRYGKSVTLKKKFGISTQHYSFADKAFVELVKHFGMDEYEFAIRETKTREVIDDVSKMKSEIGILYMSDFNRSVISKLLKTNNLSFTKLVDCHAYVYIWKNNPLAKSTSLSIKDLADYPCLSFELGDGSSFYFAEEILSTNEYPRVIKTNDRATMLNLMVGLNGYTLCSGIICEELNGSDYIAVPFRDDEEHHNSVMEIGYIVKKDMKPSRLCQEYIQEIQTYLKNQNVK